MLVDDCPMAHGPIRSTDDLVDRRHPERMAALYQDINPDATVTVERVMR